MTMSVPRILQMSVIALVAAAVSAAPMPEKAGWFGVRLAYQELHRRPWLLVAGLEPGGPAERAGLRLGDVIVSIDGSPASFPRFVDALAFFLSVEPGQSVRLEVVREERRISITARPEPLPALHFTKWKNTVDRVNRERATPRAIPGAGAARY